MPEPDAQLVQQIAQMVLRAMQSATTANAPTTTAIDPPLGQCPGAGGQADLPSNHVTPVTQSLPTAPQIFPLNESPTLDGLITAHRLDDAVASSPDGTVIFAATARLTPLAQDRVRLEPQRFHRAEVAAADGVMAALNHGQPWLWWTCGRCPAVKQIVEARRSRLLPVVAPREANALPSVLNDMNTAITAGRAAGGILFVSGASKPLCLANRLRGLRAILGHCDDAVRQGIRDVGANVLILEFPFSDHDQMAGRVDRMLTSSPAIPATTAHALVTVEGGRA